MTGYTWHVTHDMWHVTKDMWHVTHGVWWTFSLNFSSLAITVWDKWCCEYIEEKDHLLNQWINGKAVCRTALATTGLMQTHQGSSSHILAHVVINWLSQLNVGSCSYILAPAATYWLLQPFFAHAATSMLLQSHLNSWNQLLATVATSWLLELDFFCFFKSS